jgi:hypothetical protein
VLDQTKRSRLFAKTYRKHAGIAVISTYQIFRRLLNTLEALAHIDPTLVAILADLMLDVFDQVITHELRAPAGI